MPARSDFHGLLSPAVVMFSEAQLQQVWYGGRNPSWPLRMLAAVYGLLAGVRRRLYAAHLLPAVRLPVPVVVVGNVAVGGTGKTPLTIALVEGLRQRGWRPGVVSRGHGGSARTPRVVDASSDPAVVGDEACLIARATAAPVAVGRDRAAAARLLLAAGKLDVVIADDGLQHHKLCRDVEICVIDGARRFGNGRLLPAGPLREPASRAAGIALRVCNGGRAQAGEVPMRLSGDVAVALGDASAHRPLTDFRGLRIHAVAGIGNPERFFTQLRDAGVDVIEHPFPDHHAFARADIEFGDDLPVLMTQKDAVKCAGLAGPRHWVVPVRAVLPETFFDAVAKRLGAGR